MDRKFYLKATGDGFKHWFRIRGLKALKDKHTGKEYYELEIKTQWSKQYIIIGDYEPKFVAFKDDTGKPVSFITVIKHLKDKSIGLLLS